MFMTKIPLGVGLGYRELAFEWHPAVSATSLSTGGVGPFFIEVHGLYQEQNVHSLRAADDLVSPRKAFQAQFTGFVTRHNTT